MSIELSYLVASAALFIVMIVVQAVSSLMSHSLSTLAGARDDMTDKTVFAARCRRANANMVEALVIAVPLILVAVISEQTNATTALGAAMFFWARLVFAPLYWFGVSWLRTAVWGVSVVGLVMILLQILPFSGAA